MKMRSYNVKRKVKHKRHNPYKCGNGSIFARQNRVDFAAAYVFRAFGGLYNGFFAQPCYKRKSHIRDGSGAVKSALCLHLADYMLYHFLFVIGQIQGAFNKRVALGKLACGEPERNPRRLCVVFDKVH